MTSPSANTFSQRALSIYSEPVELAKILPEGIFS
jgi:hypothetical protein